MRRLLSRALLVVGGAAATWFIATGTASAHTDNAVELLAPEPIAAASATVEQAAKPVAEVAAGIAKAVEQTANQAATVVDNVVHPKPGKKKAKAGNPLEDAVQDFASLFEQSGTVVEQVTSEVASRLSPVAEAGHQTEVQQPVEPARRTDPPASGDSVPAASGSTTPAAPAASAPAASAVPDPKPGQVKDTPRQQPQPVQPGLPPVPMPAPLTAPGSCSCGSDGSGGTGLGFGSSLPGGFALDNRHAQLVNFLAAQRIAARPAKQPGVTPD